jgi:hypothetical protein
MDLKGDGTSPDGTGPVRPHRVHRKVTLTWRWRIIELEREGTSFERIRDVLASEGLNVSVATIWRNRLYPGVKMGTRKVTPDVQEEIDSLRARGLSYEEVRRQLEAEGLHLSVATVFENSKRGRARHS